MRRAAVVAIAMVSVLTGCGGLVAIGDRPGPTWLGPDDDPVPADVLSVFAAPEACGVGNGAAFLEMSWPLPGLETDDPPEPRQYVRDPEGELDTTRLLAPYDAGSSLSRDAAFSGYRTDELQLWVGADVEIYVYLVSGPRVEAWPRAETFFDCARP